jgi:voltage-gated potassium channel
MSVASPGDPQPDPRTTLVARRARRIAGRRFITLGLASTFLVLALLGAVVIWLLDEKNFSSFSLAVWWALQTVTTVGYGDVVPTTAAGKFIGSIEMVVGISFIAFLTATVTSTAIERGAAEKQKAALKAATENTQRIIDVLGHTGAAVAELNARLDRIEARLNR